MSFFEFPHTRTYDTDLGWLIKHTKTAEEAIEALNSWKEETQPTIDDFKNLYDMLMRGELPEGIQNGIEIWMRENALDLVGELIKAVHFGLTNDGYFCAYIPDSWNNIQFDTITDFDDPLYGHLVLMYD